MVKTKSALLCPDNGLVRGLLHPTDEGFMVVFDQFYQQGHSLMDSFYLSQNLVEEMGYKVPDYGYETFLRRYYKRRKLGI